MTRAADASFSPADARRTWRSLEAVHGMIYFTPDAPPRYAEVGVTHHRSGYFGSRAAAMGAVTPDVVIATFFNFHPGLVRRVTTGLWDATTPDQLLTARLAAVDSSLRRAFGDEVLASAELADAATTLRRAAEVACERPEGRPLFAGHAGLPWPDEPHLVLWHAQTLLREFRGDGHIAALVGEGLGGLDALISHAGSGDVPAAVLQATRAWSDDEWAAGVASMAERGLVHADGSFTDEGRAQRERIEAATDRLAVAPWAAIGADSCESLRAIGKDLSRRVIDAGLLAVDPKRYLED
ncbi:MAG: hypothetical protein U0Q03_09645 [Acidimicrobiales bacterium]